MNEVVKGLIPKVRYLAVLGVALAFVGLVMDLANLGGRSMFLRVIGTFLLLVGATEYSISKNRPKFPIAMLWCAALVICFGMVLRSQGVIEPNDTFNVVIGFVGLSFVGLSMVKNPRALVDKIKIRKKAAK